MPREGIFAKVLTGGEIKVDDEIEITGDELKMIDSGWDWWNDILKQLREAHLKKMVGG